MTRVGILFALVFVQFTAVGNSADWPTWRHDAVRSAVSPEALPVELHLNWSRELGPNHIAWGEDPRLQSDASYQPIVVGKTMIVASARTNSVTAYDTESGELSWSFLVGAPVRFAPVAHKGRLYFGADDGKLYCVNLATGKQVWVINAAPTNRLVIGNGKLVSVWPVRGGPVISENRLFFSIGVWPFEGTLLCHVDLDEPSNGAKPKLHTKLLDNLLPQGYLVAVGQRILMPCGRNNVACVDAATLVPISTSYSALIRYNGKTDCHVVSDGNLFFHGDGVYDLNAKQKMPFKVDSPVSNGTFVYGTIEQIIEDQPLSEDLDPKTRIIHKLAAFDLSRRETYETTDRRGETVSRFRVPKAWVMEGEEITLDNEDPPYIEVQAGQRLYGHRGRTLFALEIASDRPSVVWRYEMADQPSSMVCADGKLFVVTRNGWIHAFSAQPQKTTVHHLPTKVAKQDVQATDIEPILNNVTDRAGFCVSIGIGDGRQIEQILQQTEMQLIVIDDDVHKVEEFRQRLTSLGCYGTRATCIQGGLKQVSLPPYLADLIVFASHQKQLDADEWRAAFQVLRPYGGSLVANIPEEYFEQLDALLKEKEFSGSHLRRDSIFTILSRQGALPGAADWTHEYGDSSNTLMSQDERVRAPFGVLWFGGPASHGELFFDRHFWGPGPTVVQGRMYVQGPKRLAAIDIYTGRVLWKKKVRAGSGPGRRGNFFDQLKPGFHVVVVEDAVYIVYPEVCLVLDPKSGETKNTIRLPDAADRWGKIRVWKDQLIVTVFRDDPKLGLLPRAVTALHRETGAVTWTKEATNTVPLIAVGGNDVYLFDGYLPGFYDAWKRRGLVPPSNEARFVKSIDAATGKTNWERSIERVATWMAYSQEYDVLVVSNKHGVNAYRGYSGEGLWNKDEEAPGFGGHPENVWDKVILSGDVVIDQRGPGRAYNLVTGEPLRHKHPVTGALIPWEFTKKGHHCNYAIASPHLLTFRADTAGFFDRSSYSTSRLLGFRSGCRNSLIPAGGVLNAPNYAHGCRCSYNLFTSLALVHLPEADLWTYNSLPVPQKHVKRLGVNLGAPGDRMADDGTLWIEYPPVDGRFPDGNDPQTRDPSATVPIEVNGPNVNTFRLHSGDIKYGFLRWVGANGLTGLERVKISLPLDENSEPNSYTVRLYFLEPDETKKPGDRVFDVSMQGDVVLKGVDIYKEANGPRRILVKELRDIVIDGSLIAEFHSKSGQPAICGIQIISAND